MDIKDNNVNPPLLTIAIPTYNRRRLLNECLEAILKEINETNTRDSIEIIISDNASTDGTEEMIREKYSFIEYHRNASNLGVEQNVDKCFSYAHGEYTFIFSDDDILLPGALSEIIKAIRIKPNFIHLNTVSFYKRYTGLTSKPRLDIKKNIVTTNKNRYFELVNIYITFLSSSIYKTDIAKSIDRSIYQGTFTSSGQTVLFCLKQEGKYVIVAKPCVAGRGGNTGGYNLFTVWVKGYRDMIIGTGVEIGLNRKTIKKVYKYTMLKYVREFIHSYRTTEKGLSLEHRNYIFKGIYDFPSLWIPLLFVTYAPIAELKTFDIIKNAIKKNI